MKKTLRRILSLTLALTLATASMSAAASYALGDDLTAATTALNQGTNLGTHVFWSSTYSDLRTENIIHYTPNAAVTPRVTYGSVITERSTVSAGAKRLEAQGYRVVAGINGDFYNTSTGIPIGLVVTEGIIRTGAAGYHAIGFRADGTAVLGKPGLSYTVDLGKNANGESVLRKVTDINKSRVSEGGIYLYTYDFNTRHTNGGIEPGVDVVCSVQEGALSIGSTLTLRVENVVDATSATALAEGQVMLSCNTKSNAFFTDALRALVPGQTIAFTTSASDSRWNDVQYAVGSLYSLVENGKAVKGLAAGAAPRTAIGQKPDGSLVFYTIDGRKSGYSIGASLTQVAERLIELGCTTALCLDGGGSTTLSVTKPDKTAAATVNRPSESVERAVTNQVFLVAANTPTGILDHIYVAPANNYILAGSSVVVAASGVDTAFLPMDAACELTASAGSFTGNVLKTPLAGGDITVTAASDGKSGSAVIHAVTVPDSVRIVGSTGTITSLTVFPGDSLTLTPAAIYRHLPIAADAGAFTWSTTGEIGTISPDGTFTAAEKAGSGTLTATAGGKTASIQVRVAPLAFSTLEDYEGSFPETVGVGATLTRDTAQVRFGRVSAALSYDMAGESFASLATNYTFKKNYSRLSFWVLGDQSGNTLSLLTNGANAATTPPVETPAAVLDFAGWKQISVTLPAGTTALTGILLTGGNATGKIYLDQFVNSYGEVVDTAPPTVKASLTGISLTANVSDEVDGFLAQNRISVTHDGKAIPFNYDAAKGLVVATLPILDGKGHRVTVTAQDASGNLGRASGDVASTATVPQFTDTVGYWAAPYVDYLFTSGITTGYADGSFRPKNNISRQEFAVMLFRYLGIDGSRYENETLPFADNSQIGDFAATAIKALYTAGILNGSEQDGKLYFNPNSSITRAQAAAMIGRTQPKGYPAPALTFGDAAKIPGYAAFYVSSLAAQGVLGGYEDGRFGPADPISRGQMAKILYNLL